ncbi:MAG: choice-of-anchor J domain-containing protein [Flavobacteriales bacterium]|nr:choice-of-anchor J domain-containing protein [Flavobacteriales bacterium]
MKKLVVILIIALIVVGCKKEYDNPPENLIPDNGIITISDLRTMSIPHKFVGDSSFYGIITMDEQTGNIYKNVYIQDTSGAGMNLRSLFSGGVVQGDSIRVSLKGTILTEFDGMLQLDSVDTEKHLIKQSSGHVVIPKLVTIADINTSIQSQLVQLSGVEFSGMDVGGTWADGANQTSLNRTLVNCSGDELIVRTSGYSSFADVVIPGNSGTLIGIVGQYGTDMQLYIRTPGEAVMNDSRCTASYYAYKDFEDGSITSNGWGSFWNGTTTTANWGEWEIFGGSLAAASNFDITSFTNYVCESWLVSPAMNLSSATAPKLTFDNVVRYPGAGLELYVSTDYDGSSDPALQGTWTNLTSVVSNWDTDDGSWTLVPSGIVDLTSYISANTYIGFKYVGSASDGATWELDNIIVQE